MPNGRGATGAATVDDAAELQTASAGSGPGPLGAPQKLLGALIAVLVVLIKPQLSKEEPVTRHRGTDGPRPRPLRTRTTPSDDRRAPCAPQLIALPLQDRRDGLDVRGSIIGHQDAFIHRFHSHRLRAAAARASSTCTWPKA